MRSGNMPKSLYQNWQFAVEVNGFDVALFKKGQEPKTEFEEVAFAPAGSMFDQKVAGRVKFEDITLEKGILQDGSDEAAREWIKKQVDVNAVVGGLVKGPFSGLTLYTEVLQDTMLDFFDSGKLDFASTTSLALSAGGFQRFYQNWDRYSSKVVLRPQHLANSPEIIRRLGVIAMNTPVEFDIYAHANSTLVGGTRMINGIGGSGDFLRNAYLSIMHTPSVRATRYDPTGISCVVPMVPHVDHTEHDLDVLVTEQGLADLRGLCPRDRAQTIIDRCAHPDYRPLLQEYFDRASRACLSRGVGHEPHLLDRVFRMQQHLASHGTMKVPNWN